MVVHRIKEVVCSIDFKISSMLYSFILAHYVPLSSIFSTRVISGAKSTPDLDKLLERKQAGRMYLTRSNLLPNISYEIR
jgi:hypothetical protein